MMLLNPDIQLASFFDTLSKGPESLLILDYDGTLAPFSLDPSKSQVYPGVFDCVKKIIESNTSKVVILSGRSLSDLLTLLPKPYPELWGSHGGERLLVGADQAIEAIITPEIKELLEIGALNAKKEAPQLLCEVKPLSVALHWRGKDPKLADGIKKTWSTLIQNSLLEIQPFDGGMELRVRGIDKGKAAQVLMQECSEKAVIAYLGDDLTDEAAFQTLKNKALTVLVRPEFRPTHADIHLKPPEELIEFLNCWIQACKRSS